MRISSLSKLSLVIGAGSLLVSGCVVRERGYYRPPPPPVATVYVAPDPAPAPVVVVNAPPPAPYVEVSPTYARPGRVWVRGDWVWRGGWVWVPGHWDVPPRPGAVWVGGRYQYRGGARVYIGGYWR